jgi:hypothetical protein
MKTPLYMPYDGSTKPFSIGLSAIDPGRWLEPDGALFAYLDEKDHLRIDHFDEVFQSVSGSEDAQQECLDLITDHLLTAHADLYRRSGQLIEFDDRTVALNEKSPPLLIAGSLIQDDLAILEKKPDGWTLTAGYISFPSAWSLKEKIGLPMEGVHAHVPGFQGGTRNAMMVNRIFDNLQPDLPAMRMNWSIYPEADLFWPPERGARAEQAGFTAPANFIRVERQTLRRLPRTGAIVFTIRIYSDPIGALLSLGDEGRMARALAERLMEFTPEQLAYKGMVSKRDALVAYLRAGEAVVGS